MKKVIILNKKEGETPLEAIKSFRIKYKRYKDLKMTYAGRLDPMASGKLIILVGEETKNKEKYLGLEKEYEFSILFGFSTDTYDVLGKVLKSNSSFVSQKELKKRIKENLKYFIGEIKQQYPIYSSKTVNGIPLFIYARKGEEVEIPEKKVFIKKLKFLKIKTIDNKVLYRNIEKRIKKVNGDFRQEKILKIWKEKLEGDEKIFFVAYFKIHCSGGTYVRSISYLLGEKIGISSLAFSIKRTKFFNMI